MLNIDMFYLIREDTIKKNCPTFFHVVFILGIEFINMNDSEILEISQKFPSFGGGDGVLRLQKIPF